MERVTIKPFHGHGQFTLPWSRFAQAISHFEINHEDWACSDYARRFHGFVAYLRHFSDGEFSSFGQFTTPFVVVDADIALPDDTSSELSLRLRSDALLWFATKVLAERNVNGVVTTSGEFAGEWFTTTALPVDQVLRERGFPF
jgi:hypothetical protein